MEAINIKTAAGNLELSPATPDELKRLASRWPMGVVFSQAKDQPNGLVFQIGEQEAYCLKLQPPDADERTAKALYFHNLCLIAAALPLYLEKQHQGLILPCAYFKKKQDDRFESGTAFFANPYPDHASRPESESDALYNDRLGPGSSRMIFDMAAAIAQASKQLQLPLNTLIGLDVRPRLALGTLGMPFILFGPKVFVIQHPLNEAHPFWAFAVKAGLSSLSYAPMIPAAVPGPANVPHTWLDRVKILQAGT